MKTIKGTLAVLCIVSIVASIMYAGTLSGASASISPNPMNVSAIKGLVFHDNNLDGKYQVWEHGIPGITINLLDANGSKTDKRITDANGFFLFNDVTPGKYIVSEDIPSNLTNTSPANIPVDLPRNTTVGVCIGNRNTTPTPTPTTTPTPTPTITPTPTPTITPTPTPTITPTPTPSPSVSPRTIGYWKNHQNNIAPYLPIYLGTFGGPRTTNVTTVFQAVYILNQHDPSNGIDKLKAQLLAAKLNIANGADGSSIAGTIAAADSFLATHAEPAWSSLSSTDQQYVLSLKDALDTYNNVI